MMVTRRWTLPLNNRVHTVELEYNPNTNRRQVTVDGQTVVDETRLIDPGSEYPFYIDGHLCTMRIKQSLTSHSFDLVVDGLSQETGEIAPIFVTAGMERRAWEVMVDGTRHRVEFAYGGGDRRRALHVDGKMVLVERGSPLSLPASIPFEIDRRGAVITIAKNGWRLALDLMVDGGTVTPVEWRPASHPTAAPAEAGTWRPTVEAAAATQDLSTQERESLIPRSGESEREEQLRTAERQIRNGWIAGLFAGLPPLLTGLFLPNLTYGGVSPGHSMAVGGLLLLGLTAGVYKRSRACAVALFTIFVLDKTLLIIMSDRPVGPFLPFLIAWFLAQGVQGTFTYHRIMKQTT